MFYIIVLRTCTYLKRTITRPINQEIYIYWVIYYYTFHISSSFTFPKVLGMMDLCNRIYFKWFYFKSVKHLANSILITLFVHTYKITDRRRQSQWTEVFSYFTLYRPLQHTFKFSQISIVFNSHRSAIY